MAGTEHRTESLISKDGTMISYRVLGRGPGLIILPGANQASQHYLTLASCLAEDFTVYVVDRRGRNGSGPQGEDYSLTKECEDTTALLHKVQAPFLFGHSYGGVIALHVACQYPLEKIVLYEPPVSAPTAWIARFLELLEQGDYIGAQVAMVKGLELGGNLNSLPDHVFKKILASYMKEEEQQESAKLLQTVQKEMLELIKLGSKVDQYAQIKAETFLLAGGESPAYFHQSLETLTAVLTHAQVKVFSRLDHTAPNLSAPVKVAQAAKEFLEQHL